MSLQMWWFIRTSFLNMVNYICE